MLLEFKEKQQGQYLNDGAVDSGRIKTFYVFCRERSSTPMLLLVYLMRNVPWLCGKCVCLGIDGGRKGGSVKECRKIYIAASECVWYH